MESSPEVISMTNLTQGIRMSVLALYRCWKMKSPLSSSHSKESFLVRYLIAHRQSFTMLSSVEKALIASKKISKAPFFSSRLESPQHTFEIAQMKDFWRVILFWNFLIYSVDSSIMF